MFLKIGAFIVFPCIISINLYPVATYALAIRSLIFI